jgi:hypothetical protein
VADLHEPTGCKGHWLEFFFAKHHFFTIFEPVKYVFSTQCSSFQISNPKFEKQFQQFMRFNPIVYNEGIRLQFEKQFQLV